METQSRDCIGLTQNSSVSTGKFSKRLWNFGGNAYLYHRSLALFSSISCRTLALGLNKAQNSSFTFVSSFFSSHFCLTTKSLLTALVAKRTYSSRNSSIKPAIFFREGDKQGVMMMISGLQLSLLCQHACYTVCVNNNSSEELGQSQKSLRFTISMVLFLS